MFLAEVDAACADRCEAPGIGGPYRAEKGHPRVARQPDASEFAVHRSPTVGALREVDDPDCIAMIENRHDSNSPLNKRTIRFSAWSERKPRSTCIRPARPMIGQPTRSSRNNTSFFFHS